MQFNMIEKHYLFITIILFYVGSKRQLVEKITHIDCL